MGGGRKEKKGGGGRGGGERDLENGAAARVGAEPVRWGEGHGGGVDGRTKRRRGALRHSNVISSPLLHEQTHSIRQGRGAEDPLGRTSATGLVKASATQLNSLITSPQIGGCSICVHEKAPRLLFLNSDSAAESPAPQKQAITASGHWWALCLSGTLSSAGGERAL